MGQDFAAWVTIFVSVVMFVVLFGLFIIIYKKANEKSDKK